MDAHMQTVRAGLSSVQFVCEQGRGGAYTELKL